MIATLIIARFFLLAAFSHFLFFFYHSSIKRLRSRWFKVNFSDFFSTLRYTELDANCRKLISETISRISARVVGFLAKFLFSSVELGGRGVRFGARCWQWEWETGREALGEGLPGSGEQAGEGEERGVGWVGLPYSNAVAIEVWSVRLLAVCWRRCDAAAAVMRRKTPGCQQFAC